MYTYVTMPANNFSKDCCGCRSDLASREGHTRSLGTSKGEKALNVWRKMLKKFRNSDREQVEI